MVIPSGVIFNLYASLLSDESLLNLIAPLFAPFFVLRKLER